jgi:hypothetical protein
MNRFGSQRFAPNGRRRFRLSAGLVIANTPTTTRTAAAAAAGDEWRSRSALDVDSASWRQSIHCATKREVAPYETRLNALSTEEFAANSPLMSPMQSPPSMPSSARALLGGSNVFPPLPSTPPPQPQSPQSTTKTLNHTTQSPAPDGEARTLMQKLHHDHRVKSSQLGKTLPEVAEQTDEEAADSNRISERFAMAARLLCCLDLAEHRRWRTQNRGGTPTPTRIAMPTLNGAGDGGISLTDGSGGVGGAGAGDGGNDSDGGASTTSQSQRQLSLSRRQRRELKRAETNERLRSKSQAMAALINGIGDGDGGNGGGESPHVSPYKRVPPPSPMSTQPQSPGAQPPPLAAWPQSPSSTPMSPFASPSPSKVMSGRAASPASDAPSPSTLVSSTTLIPTHTRDRFLVSRFFYFQSNHAQVNATTRTRARMPMSSACSCSSGRGRTLATRARNNYRRYWLTSK